MGESDSHVPRETLLAPLQPLVALDGSQIELNAEKCLPDDGHTIVRRILAKLDGLSIKCCLIDIAALQHYGCPIMPEVVPHLKPAASPYMTDFGAVFRDLCGDIAFW